MTAPEASWSGGWIGGLDQGPVPMSLLGPPQAVGYQALPPQAVGYQALPPYAPAWQLADGARLLAAAASDRGWPWGGTYSERTELRGLAAFGELLAAISREPLLEVVLVRSVADFGRTARVQARLYEILSDAGVRVVVLDGSTPATWGEQIPARSGMHPLHVPQALTIGTRWGARRGVRLVRRVHGRWKSGAVLLRRVPRPRGSESTP